PADRQPLRDRPPLTQHTYSLWSVRSFTSYHRSLLENDQLTASSVSHYSTYSRSHLNTCADRLDLLFAADSKCTHSRLFIIPWWSLESFHHGYGVQISVLVQ
ncbi:unnamed protein product, partial [Cylicocyclus nassatus]